MVAYAVYAAGSRTFRYAVGQGPIRQFHSTRQRTYFQGTEKIIEN